MGIGDKMQNQFEKAKGKAKETTGDATDDESMQAEGKGEQMEADAKQAVEKGKDAWKSGSE
jgi:uncharacterized protein YjbJ (UPF0337 family)